jgi:protein-tyrosine phosphatase
MNQVQLSGVLPCKAFRLHKMMLNVKNAKVVCIECGGPLLDHRADACSEEDVFAYLAHVEGHDGGNEILAEDGGLGALWCGSRGASLRPFVLKHKVGAVVNASNLHLEQRRDFQEWARKVEAVEKEGLIEVLRLGWEDTEVQELTRLEDAVRFIHRQRLKGVNVVCHCAQGKSRSGAVIVAYLMALHKTSFEEALQTARRARALIEPNANFAAQLKKQEKLLIEMAL